MKPLSLIRPFPSPLLAWLTVALVGFAAPATAMLLLLDWIKAAPLPSVTGPTLAVGLMGAGMIGAAAAGRFWIGVLLALMTGVSLMVIAHTLGEPTAPHWISIGLTACIASLSFAARGALFARSASAKGWWIAVLVVAGEAAVLLTALARPGSLPDWVLALLPAQWTNIALQTALAGKGAHAASSALIALGGTAATTLLVLKLWPRRWPYILMFTVWLGLSALVWYRPAPPISHAGTAIVAAAAEQVTPIATLTLDTSTTNAALHSH